MKKIIVKSGTTSLISVTNANGRKCVWEHKCFCHLNIRRSKWYRNGNHDVAKSIPEISWNSKQYKLLGCSTGTTNGDVSLCAWEVTTILRNKVRTSGDLMLAFLLLAGELDGFLHSNFQFPKTFSGNLDDTTIYRLAIMRLARRTLH